MENFDFIVIGGGPGGYVSAIRASQLGLKVLLIEKQHLGGVCLNWGCIPTKALLRAAEYKCMLDNANEFGFEVKYKYDFGTVIKRSREVSKTLSNGVIMLLKKNKVTILTGHGLLKGNGIVAVQKEDGTVAEYKGESIILATGARPRIFKGLEPNYKNIITSKEAMVLDELPKSLIVIGSGAIGVEFASFYNSMGSSVTLCEAQESILPLEDHEISGIAATEFVKKGIKILTSATLESFQDLGTSVKVVLNQKGSKIELNAEKVILAMGIETNIENIGLENTKVQTERGHIVVDEFCKTHEKSVYAIGDIADSPWLAHKASHEGVLVAEHAKGMASHTFHKTSVPACVYSMPQIASIGITEKEAMAQNLAVKIGKFPYIGNGKAVSMGETTGLVKTIFDAKTGELLGAHMIGAEVTELIHGFTIAKILETTEVELMQTIFPHPTMSEMMHESVLNAYNRALHI